MSRTAEHRQRTSLLLVLVVANVNFLGKYHHCLFQRNSYEHDALEAAAQKREVYIEATPLTE
jgi:hypothetical protein